MGGRESNANREFQIPAHYREKKTKEMFSFLRFVHAKGPELLALPPDGMKFARHSYDEEEEVIVFPPSFSFYIQLFSFYSNFPFFFFPLLLFVRSNMIEI